MNINESSDKPQETPHEDLLQQGMVRSIPVADVSVPSETGPLTTNVRYVVEIPPEEKLAVFVSVRASQLSRCREELDSLTNRCFPLHELCLGIAGLCGGGSLGALVQGTSLSSILGVLFYVVLPIVTAISGTTYFFLRREEISSPLTVARRVLRDLPDPAKPEGGRGES